MLIKLKKLNEGDTVALITLSSAGAYKYPARYAIGKKQIEDSLKIKIIETPNATKSKDFIYNNPLERLNDLIWAFKNPEVKAIVSITGGDDSIRLLNFLTEEHLNIMRKNPKIFIGMSDTTTISFLCLKAGIVSFYGPCVLFGLAENGGIDEYTIKYLKKALFESGPMGKIENNPNGWTLDRVSWEISNIKRKMQKPIQMKFLQGKGISEGNIIGGCMDVIEFLKGTTLWPSKEVWRNAILLLETSEDKPSPCQVKYWLRNYGAQGILNSIKGIIFGIPGGDINYDDPNYDAKLKEHLDSFDKYDKVFLDVCKEYNANIPIVTRIQIGHVAPMLTLPLGIKAQIDCNKKEIRIIEAGVE
jgi:muramoyltetrapeptide carboxypeptidase LdcA involved in peptidoglycan recycling